ncbi:ubiquitin carboxyl-terminal hydrolase 8-like protein [Leptotrombidium deliense]|uniref:Ubiquitin carboxyl-terminal hydrolase n=1 Tax=Leptotrombidium deliense TaxID=299467 RepID=A0A443SVP9_9ACAR|nr:ubiquitin carboxyl-terminal hydrolase 8-like protein [Leptotrombidium deliense]
MPSLRNNSSTLGAGGVKKLYLAHSLKELNGFIDKSMVEVNRSEPAAVLKSLVKSYEEAKKELLSGDEERAYLLFMRTVNAYMKVKEKCTARKESYYDLMFSQSKVKECVDVSEKLIESLERRYEALQESNKVTNSDSLNNNSTEIVNSAAQEPQTNDPITNNSIQCTELYDIIDNLSKTNDGEDSVQILLIDARSEQDFNESNLKLNKNKCSNKLIVLNVPENLLEPGLTIRKLEKFLPPQTVTALKNRRSAKKVIIFDWSSKSLSDSNKLDALFCALWKWDKTSERSKSIPVILKGGYEEWLLTYPTLTTNAKVLPPVRVVSSPVKRPAANFEEMMALIEDKPVEKVQKPEMNGFCNETKEESNYRKNLTDKMSNLLPDNPSIKAPGSAKTVPVIDRSKKPSPSEVAKSETNEKQVNDSMLSSELLRIRKQKEAEEEMKKTLQQQEELQRLNVLRLKEENRKKDEDLKKLREENVSLKRNIKPTPENNLPKVATNSVSTPKAEVNGDENDKSYSPTSSRSSSSSSNRNSTFGGDEGRITLRKANEVRPSTERTMSESTGSSLTPKPSNTLSVSSNLSRSHSSPNIAQLLEEEGENNILSKSRSTTNPPQFDRTLKPTSLVSDFTANKPLSASVARSRNFSPIYGISGQAITGLRNLGNTCFMNSIIQCLSSTIDLAVYCNQERYLQDLNKHSKFGSRGEIAEEFAVLVRQMWTCQYKSLSPKDFKSAVGSHLPVFVGCDQQDAHEFLVMLLEKLHADLNRGKSDDKAVEIKDDIATHLAIKAFWHHHVDRNLSIISELFEGLLLSTLTCGHCGKISNSFEVFSCLSLPIPTSHGNRCNLLDCLKLFSEPERMTGEAAWDCPTCKMKRDAVKKITICRLPRVLLIHLKRFSYEGMWRQKLQTSIEFPLTDLSLRNFRYVNQNDITQQYSYDLYGVVNHYGTLEGGHYTAFCKHMNTKRWYKFDDHEVSEISSLDVKTQAAYILFYTASQINT